MKSPNTSNNIQKNAMRISRITIGINLLLSVFKLAVGILASSGAMISDAVHSASDVFSTIIVMIGIAISEKKSDRNHPYGHERMECVASVLLAVVLALTGFGIGINGIKVIIGSDNAELQIPGIMALIAALLSIAVKEWMYQYTRSAAKKIRSGALMADAWHHRSDALSSIGALIGILGARLGYPILDPLASVVICLFIEKAALDIFKNAVNQMVDKACPDTIVQKMRRVISDQEGVCSVDDLKTRQFGAKIYVDAEISADGRISLNRAHEIAEGVHSAIEDAFPDVKHCMVHVNPVLTDSSVPLSDPTNSSLHSEDYKESTPHE